MLERLVNWARREAADAAELLSILIEDASYKYSKKIKFFSVDEFGVGLIEIPLRDLQEISATEVVRISVYFGEDALFIRHRMINRKLMPKTAITYAKWPVGWFIF